MQNKKRMNCLIGGVNCIDKKIKLSLHESEDAGNDHHHDTGGMPYLSLEQRIISNNRRAYNFFY